MIDFQRNFDFNLERCWRIIRRFWYVILIGFLLGLSGGICYYGTVTPLYKSQLRFFTWNQTVAEAAREIGSTAQQEGDKAQAVIMYNNLISQSMIIGQSLVNDYKQLLENPSVARKVQARLAQTGQHDYKLNITSNRQSCIITIEAVSPSATTAQAAVDTTMAVFQDEQERLMGVRFAQLIEAGNLPTVSFFPNWKRVIPIGALLGLLVGLAVAFLWDFMDFTVRTPEEIEQLDLLFLGELTAHRKLEESLSLETMEQDRSNRLPDEMMMVKTNLRHRNIENHQRTILVTSDSPACGKSTFCVLLAQTMASGGKILLIDCDLRKPSLFLKLQMVITKGGLVDCLLGLPEGKKPQDFIVPTAFPNVDFMSYGQLPRRPIDFFESSQFSEMLELLKGDYKHIILDSPPVRGMADAFLLAQKVDGIILLVKHAQTRLDHFKRLILDWQEMKHKILGVVINQKNTQFHSYYGYYGYGQGQKHDTPK